MPYTMSSEAQTELHELLEDTVSHFCQENMVSGELAWLIVQCYGTAKHELIKGNVK